MTLTASLEQQPGDFRSNELAFILRLANKGPDPLQLVSLTPRLPENDVKQIDINSQSGVELAERRKTLCRELTEMLRRQIRALEVEETRHRRSGSTPLRNLPRLVVTFPVLLVTGYIEMLRKIIDPAEDDSASLARKIEIGGLSDAREARRRFFPAAEKDALLAKLFDAKVNQLKEVEKRLAPTKGEAPAIAQIQPNSEFIATYVLRFRRAALNSRTYGLAVDATCGEGAGTGTTSATTSVIISPRPFTLTLITLIASALGVVLRVAIDPTNGPSTAFRNAATEALTGGPIAAAMILALVIFNVFEITKYAKEIRLGAGWRSALLIGVLCGLLSDRFVDALKGFLGE